jgi:hypothetical protein
MAGLMCEECERAETLAAVYIRKANRYGWRPPAETATMPRYHDTAAAIAHPPGRGPACVEVAGMNGAK